MRRNHRKLSLESSSLSSSSGREPDGRLTPVRKTGSRVNSPIVHDIIEEEAALPGRKSPSSRNRSAIDLLESVEDKLNTDKKRQNVSRSSSGRSNKSLKMKHEFVKYV